MIDVHYLIQLNGGEIGGYFKEYGLTNSFSGPDPHHFLQDVSQLIAFLEKYEYTGSTVEMKEMLHLKTGLAYLENNRLLTAGEFIQHPLFALFRRIPIDPQEAYAANCIYVNGTVLVPAGYPLTQAKIEALGLPTLPVDTSEFRKLDGGLSCLSLRF